MRNSILLFIIFYIWSLVAYEEDPLAGARHSTIGELTAPTYDYDEDSRVTDSSAAVPLPEISRRNAYHAVYIPRSRARTYYQR